MGSNTVRVTVCGECVPYVDWINHSGKEVDACLSQRNDAVHSTLCTAQMGPKATFSRIEIRSGRLMWLTSLEERNTLGGYILEQMSGMYFWRLCTSSQGLSVLASSNLILVCYKNRLRLLSQLKYSSLILTSWVWSPEPTLWKERTYSQ